MPVPSSFRGHGTFIYDAGATVRSLGSAGAVADAIQRCRMSSAWIRVHGRRDGYGHDPATQDLVGALRGRGIAVAGWGWCQGDDPAAEAALAIENLRALNLTDYVADIEEGVNQSHWTTAEVADLLARVRTALTPGGAIAVSSFALVTWHSPELMQAAEAHVDAFAPQTYWFHFPSRRMQREFGNRYTLDNAATYVELSIADWRRITAKPLITTGQAYWKEGITRSDAEQKVREFTRDFAGWPELAGFNWWHFGGGDAMSTAMSAAIADAQLDQKPYAP